MNPRKRRYLKIKAKLAREAASKEMSAPVAEVSAPVVEVSAPVVEKPPAKKKRIYKRKPRSK